MNTKKIIFFTALSLLAVVFVTENSIMFGFCQNIEVYNEVMKRCVGGGLLPEHIVQLVGFLSLALLLLSVITYKMREEVFRAWWGFARWWVPVIVVATILLENAGGSGGLGIGGAVADAFVILVLAILYAILVVTCLVKIIRAYLKTKHT